MVSPTKKKTIYCKLVLRFFVHMSKFSIESKRKISPSIWKKHSHLAKHFFVSLCLKLFEVNFNLHYVNRYVARGCEEPTIRCQISITLSFEKKRQYTHGWKEPTILQSIHNFVSISISNLHHVKRCVEQKDVRKNIYISMCHKIQHQFDGCRVEDVY